MAVIRQRLAATQRRREGMYLRAEAAVCRSARTEEKLQLWLPGDNSGAAP